MLVLRGDHVVLRPLRLDELELVYNALKGGGFVAGGGPSRERLRRRIERSGQLWRGRLDLGIEVRGRLVGELDARHPARALPPGVFEIGISLFDPAVRGKGYGAEATALLTTYLFEHAEAGRVQASTAVANAPMRRVLERLGFTEEGILRGFFPGEDGREDYVMYAMTRDDWSRAGLH